VPFAYAKLVSTTTMLRIVDVRIRSLEGSIAIDTAQFDEYAHGGLLVLL
jgi:hypothetical protein